jgi:tRNA(Ile)-lysidine synthase
MPAQSNVISTSEATTLFSGLQTFPVLVLAVSGGPDSTALMVLAARWRDTLKAKPKLIAVTVDHGLRKESKREAAAVARLARKLKITHRTLRWSGRKPATGLQEAGRAARYRLLRQAARKANAAHILTAHTLDDQAETVLIRMSRGSGLTGLGAMTRLSALPEGGEDAITLVRPLLDIPKARLVATLRAAEIPYADDPSNRDPRFTRTRLRAMMDALADEGLDASRLAQLARRLKRAETAIEASVDRAGAERMV